MSGVSNSNLERKRKYVGKDIGPSPAKQAFRESLSIPINFSGRKFINQLNPQLKRATIRARLIVCNRGSVPSKKINFLSLVFLDGSGEIRATIWREKLDIWQQRLVINTVGVYRIDSVELVFDQLISQTLCLRCTHRVRFTALPVIKTSRQLFRKFVYI